MNKLTIIGNVTKEVDHRTTTSGTNVCTFVVAVNDKYNKEKPAQFFRVTAWRKLADSCAEFITKGMKVCVIGPVELSEFDDKQGVHRSILAVTADDVEFLGKSSKSASSEDYNNAPEVPETSSSYNGGGFTAVETDELPF